MSSAKTINRSFLNATFPFYIKIDKSGNVRDAGKSILKLVPDIINQPVKNLITVKRPHSIDESFDALVSHENKLIFCEFNLPTGTCYYKGQVIHLEDERRLCFLCTLVLNDPNDLTKHKLTLNDFSISDSSADLLQVLQVNKMVTADLEKMNGVLIEKEKKYSDIIEHANEIIFTTDLSGNFTYMNEVGIKILELDPDTLEELSFADLIVPEHVEKIMNIGRQILAEEIEVGYVEFQLKGSNKWIGQNITKFSNVEIDGFQGIGRDITEKKHYEEIIIQESQKATEAAKSKSRFLANMSHEIRTPLNGIMGLTELLIKGELNPQQKRYLDAIKASSETLMVVINDILDISKIESGKMEISKRPFNLRLSISQMIELMEGKAAEKNLKLISKIDKQLPKLIIGDEARLNQMLFNLVGNAIKFTSRGHINIDVKVISLHENKVSIDIEIKDTGIGIPREKLGNVFRAFQQVDDAENRSEKGTGLGLTITKRLVELMHGNISVESELGEGSTFSLSIPFEIGKDVTEEPETNVNKRASLNFDQVKILLAEDNPINQMVTIDILKEYDITVDLAENGEEAVTMMNDNNYDIILMDMQMPIIDGYEAMTVIREKHGYDKLKILALTAHVNEGEIKKCKDHGANLYLSKPFKPKALYDSLVELYPEAKKKNFTTIKDKNSNILEKSIIDINRLKQYTAGIPKVTKSTIALLIEEIPKDIDSLRKEVNKSNFERIKAIAHRTKPNFKMILPDSRVKPLLEMEQMATDKKGINLIQQNMTEIESMQNSIIQSLQNELKKLENE